MNKTPLCEFCKCAIPQRIYQEDEPFWICERQVKGFPEAHECQFYVKEYEDN